MNKNSNDEMVGKMILALQAEISEGRLADVRIVHNLVEDIILTEGEISPLLFNVTKVIFERSDVANIVGMDSVVREFYFNFEHMRPELRLELLDTIVLNYGIYSNEGFCLTVCDFIARKYPPLKARNAFSTMCQRSTLHGANGLILGEDILSKRL